MTFRELLLLWWGSLHIGEVIRRRAVQRELRGLLSSSVLQSFSSSVHAHEVRVLDAGCGRGDIALRIARRYPNVTVDAVDIDPKLVELVQSRGTDAGLRNVSVQQADIEKMQPFNVTVQRNEPRHRQPSDETAKYATIYSVDVFEHLKDPARALANLATALAPGGALLIHVPRATQRRFFRRFEHYGQYDHERDGFEPEELTELMRSVRTPEVEEEQGDGKTSGVRLEVIEVRHTFGPPGALAWELFHLANSVGKWLALLTYPVPWTLAWIDGWFRWKRGNGMLVIARIESPRTKFQIPRNTE